MKLRSYLDRIEFGGTIEPNFARMFRKSLICGPELPHGMRNSLLARTLHQLARKIGQGFDWLRNFLSEWNNHVYFRVKKIPQAIKD